MILNEEISVYISNFLNFLKEAECLYLSNLNEMKRQEAIETDCHHIREGCVIGSGGKKRKLTPKEKRRLDKIEEKCLVERRKCVDMIDKLQPLMELLGEKETKEFVKKAKDTLGNTRRIENNQKNRFYIPKVLSVNDVFDLE